jgi:hypothetical protein
MQALSQLKNTAALSFSSKFKNGRCDFAFDHTSGIQDLFIRWYILREKTKKRAVYYTTLNHQGHSLFRPSVGPCIVSAHTPVYV